MIWHNLKEMKTITKKGGVIRLGVTWAIKAAAIAVMVYTYFAVYKFFIIEILLKTED